MPTFVRTEKCDGCKGQDSTACMYICPHDLMKLDKDGSDTGHAMKSYNQEPEQCWECYSCVKICPQNAIECRHYADVVPLGGSVQPLRGTDSIMWTIKFRNGNMKRFKFPIRTLLKVLSILMLVSLKLIWRRFPISVSSTIMSKTVSVLATQANCSANKQDQANNFII